MKKLPILIFIIWLFSISAFAQEAKLIDAFQKPMSCGDFMSRIDSVYALFKNSPDIQIYVIYYGGRYRREIVWNKHTKIDEIHLEYPHREDGLKWSKAIPLYLTTFKPFPKELRENIKDNIFLIDGGFRENTEVEIWITSKGGEDPQITPTISEKDIKFRKEKPFGTPDYTQCYEGSYN